MTYKLIHDRDKLAEFVALLPDLREAECYYLILIARRKWNQDAAIPSAIKLKRGVAQTKDLIERTVLQWETAVGNYSKDGVGIPQDNLGVYLAFNPRDQVKATHVLMEKCIDAVRAKRSDINPRAMADDAVQECTGNKHFIDIDVDVKDGESAKEIASFIRRNLPDSEMMFIKTSGGFHCLVKKSTLNNKTRWYQNMKKHQFKSDVNIMANDMVPLVGCNQGKFIPYITTIDQL